MNEDIIKGNWKQIQGEAKKQWGDLTDDEIQRLDGKRDKFEGTLQERYGRSKEQARDDVNNFLNKFRDK